jgi:hypothetical protein
VNVDVFLLVQKCIATVKYNRDHSLRWDLRLSFGTYRGVFLRKSDVSEEYIARNLRVEE